MDCKTSLSDADANYRWKIMRFIARRRHQDVHSQSGKGIFTVRAQIWLRVLSVSSCMAIICRRYRLVAVSAKFPDWRSQSRHDCKSQLAIASGGCHLHGHSTCLETYYTASINFGYRRVLCQRATRRHVKCVGLSHLVEDS